MKKTTRCVNCGEGLMANPVLDNAAEFPFVHLDGFIVCDWRIRRGIMHTTADDGQVRA